MKFFKRIIAAAVVICTMVSLTACKDTTWAYKYGDYTVNAGLYIANTITAFSQAQTHADVNPEVKDPLKQTLDGKPAKQWIIDRAKELCDEYIAVEKEFDKMGLTLSDEDKSVIDNKTKVGYDALGYIYDKNGVGIESYRKIVTSGQKKDIIFDKYYAKGGSEEVPNDDLLVYFEDNFALVNSFTVELETGTELTEEQKEKNKELEAKAEEYVELINSKKKTFNEVMDMYVHYLDGDTHDDSDAEDVIKKDEETTTLVKKDSTVPSEKAVKAIFDDMEVDGDAIVIPDDKALYVTVRYDVTKDETKYDEMREAVLYEVKGEEFLEKIKTWAEAVKGEAVANEASIKRYDPKNIDMSY